MRSGPGVLFQQAASARVFARMDRHIFDIVTERGMGTKLLIVEDDKNLNMMIQLILKNKKLDWEFRSARDGAEALEVLKEYKADLALIDLAMPRMSGVELIAQI